MPMMEWETEKKREKGNEKEELKKIEVAKKRNDLDHQAEGSDVYAKTEIGYQKPTCYQRSNSDQYHHERTVDDQELEQHEDLGEQVNE